MIDRRTASGLLAEHVITRQLWGPSSFFLLDVGCSGGLERLWRVFGDRLRAIGFDPLKAEVERLNDAETREQVSYVAASVTCHDFDRLFPPALRNDGIASKNDEPFPRVSAAAAQARAAVSYTQTQFNAGAPVVMSQQAVVLDDYIESRDRQAVDFLKVDTDGHDIEVILGAKSIMAAGGILGLKVEVQLHGPVHPYANVFSNIDRELREQGFTLFDLTTYRYSRQHLPAPFLFDLAAQTISGQILAGDAVYFRDLGSLDYERMWSYQITPDRVLKLACLFDLFELPDCAAELIINRGTFLQPAIRDQLLDLLAAGEPGSYATRVGLFERDFEAFYPSRLPPVMSGPTSVDTVRPDKGAEGAEKQVRRLRDRLTALKVKNASLRERLKVRDDRIDQLTRRVEREQKP
jgi:Methyltransferase FkbM domain